MPKSVETPKDSKPVPKPVLPAESSPVPATGVPAKSPAAKESAPLFSAVAKSALSSPEKKQDGPAVAFSFAPKAAVKDQSPKTGFSFIPAQKKEAESSAAGIFSFKKEASVPAPQPEAASPDEKELRTPEKAGSSPLKPDAVEDHKEAVPKADSSPSKEPVAGSAGSALTEQSTPEPPKEKAADVDNQATNEVESTTVGVDESGRSFAEPKDATFTVEELENTPTTPKQDATGLEEDMMEESTEDKSTAGFGSFGFSTEPKNTVNPMFAVPASTSAFSSPAKESAFGKPSFGGASSAFGQTSATPAKESAFGKSSFGGASSAFGQASATPAFGQSGFGGGAFSKPAQPAFTPISASSGFGQAASSSTSAFGQVAASSAFGDSSPF
ncbi:hypothetical protein HDU91_001612, partial [Kappamyces sp. JEL0680]